MVQRVAGESDRKALQPQLPSHMGKVLMKSGAIVYSKSQVERYMACGLVLEVDAEIADDDSALEDIGS